VFLPGCNRAVQARDANSAGPGGPPGPLGLTIASDSDPLPVELVWDLMEVTYRWPPWLSGSYPPRSVTHDDFDVSFSASTFATKVPMRFASAAWRSRGSELRVVAACVFRVDCDVCGRRRCATPAPYGRGRQPVADLRAGITRGCCAILSCTLARLSKGMRDGPRGGSTGVTAVP
jgi:hypothetical protein